MDNIILHNKLALLPDELKSEVADFIDFLVSKAKDKNKKASPQFGSGKNIFVVKPGFDEPLNDFREYMS